MKHDFQQRRERRIANAKRLAKKNESEAETLYNSAREMASFIPMGQPILVGHHSEKADRRYRDKIHNKFGKSFEKMDRAAYYESKAESIANNDAISSDDPNALEKLEEKLKSLQDEQEFMKSANRYIKKKDKDGFLKIANATEKLWEELTTPNVMGYIGFASYSLSNNNANIRQVQNRIAQLKNHAERQQIDKTINGISILENTEANRLQIIFEGKPSEETRKRLKARGFRWSPSEGAWQRHISNDAYHSAMAIAESTDNEN
ncbi:DUF3560 domain-containing protein [Nubsella zeaxanthinifaciens]|uniref:DUF3560 domain-containing protein n=1 Tax=Nubsella zeaxanthinifaciens TaxID=392412 RepID=UPI000DE49F0C|nr:DUF3560 domain-containing protein [Nubsella zeaxanthinifaciens]